MTFTLNTVVPWGRSFKEYTRMFDLTDADLEGYVLGSADGPASFNVEATRMGTRVVSCDPLYALSGPQIRERIRATFSEVIEQIRRNQNEFVWTEFISVDDVGRVRMEAMDAFLGDYETGLEQGRYVDTQLPSLPFDGQSFDLALCSHFPFLYSDQFSEDFHTDAITEMARVAGEARIFPLTALGGAPSMHLAPVIDPLQQAGLSVTVERVQRRVPRAGRVAARSSRRIKRVKT